MKSFVIISTLLISSFSFASEVMCWVPGAHQDQEKVVLRMEKGEIVKWDDNHVARPDAKSLFGLFSDPIDAGPIEGIRFSKGKNGYAMVKVITTADALTVGISADLTKGFHFYQDLGSGNGNERLVLDCKKLR